MIFFFSLHELLMNSRKSFENCSGQKKNCVSCEGHDFLRLICCMSFPCFMIGSFHLSASVSILLSATKFCSAHSVKRNKKQNKQTKTLHELTYWNNEARLWRTKKAWSGLSAQKWWRNAITFVTIAANSLLWRQPAWGKTRENMK